jgi:small subunit ribosomal protein S17
MTQTDDTEPETPEAEAPGAEAPEAEASEQASEAPGAEAPEQAAEATTPPAAQEPSPGPTEPEEQLPPKARRRLARSKHSGEALEPRTAQERHAERLAKRKAKASRRRLRRSQEREKAAKRRPGAPSAEPLAPIHPPRAGKGRERQGIVVSSKADKTITVRIDVARQHRRYEKTVRSSSTVHAHDEANEAHEGDVVRVVESRPLSRTKRWKLVDVLERAR